MTIFIFLRPGVKYGNNVSYHMTAYLEVMTRCNGTMEQYCWPSRCHDECPIEKLGNDAHIYLQISKQLIPFLFILEGDDWYLPRLENSCWYQCDSKGGRCGYCEPDSEGSDGYCCRVGSTNGDCPTEAVNLLAKKSSISASQHMCVASTRPRSKLLNIENTKNISIARVEVKLFIANISKKLVVASKRHCDNIIIYLLNADQLT